MAPIDEALAAIESLEPGEDFSYTEIANEFGVVRSTLARRHQGQVVPRESRQQHQGHLTPHEETELVQHIKTLSKRHLPPTYNII